MNYFKGGFVQIPRTSLVDDLLIGQKNEAALLFWLWNLAAYQSKKAKSGSKLIDLKPGQISMTIAEISKVCGLSRQQTRTAISNLEKWGKINHNSNHKSQVITVCNFMPNNETERPSNHNTNHWPTTTQPQLFSDNHNSNHIEETATMEYERVYGDEVEVDNHNFNQTLIREEGNKENNLNLQSGGNSLACARPGNSDHHYEWGKIRSAKEALDRAEEESKVLKLRGGLNDEKLRAKIVQVVKDHFDFAFRNEKTFAKRGFAGFDYNALNETVASLGDEMGFEWVQSFGQWLCEYKRGLGGTPLKVERIAQYRKSFDNGISIESLTEMSRNYMQRRGK